jgi:hypothetical protein
LHMQWPLTSQSHGSVSQREQLVFIMDWTPYPYPTRSLPAQFWYQCTEWSTVWVLSKPLITIENWPGWGLNLDLPYDTLVLYPLLHELMLISMTLGPCLDIIYLFIIYLDINKITWNFLYPGMESNAGLPDFSWYNITTRENIYQISIKYTKYQ